MTTVTDVFRRYGPAYRTRFGEHIPAHHRTVMAAIEQCRTEALGGHLYACPACATTRYSYHSCRNRHCPTCQQGHTQTWLAQQQQLLLPVPYFLVTFTLPSELRSLARQHQRRVYSLLFRSSATALQQLAAAPRFLGGQVGMLGVLQTWTRDLRYHPHIHYLVPGGALASDGSGWREAKGRILLHVKPLAALFRGKVRAALQQLGLERQTPSKTWNKPWVVDCRPVGSGQAALKYLAPYIFRVALSNNRIVSVANDEVTFRYRVGDTKKTKTCTLAAEKFIARYLEHVLPRGFVKVRYFGLFSPGKRQVLAQIREKLAGATPAAQAPASSCMMTPTPPEQDECPTMRCPSCGTWMDLTQVLMPASRSPPHQPG